MAEASKAQKMFEDGHACSQAVLTAFAHRYNLPEELALKLSCSFGGGMGRQGMTCGAVTGALMVLGLAAGGGMGRQGMTCGAVTGALMVLGLAAGRVDPDDDAAREKNDVLVQEFFRRFQDKHNTLICNELTGIEMSCPDARTLGKEDGRFDQVCPGVVGFAAELVTELLEIDAK